MYFSTTPIASTDLRTSTSANWIHIAIVYNAAAGTIKFFRNGALDGQSTVSDPTIFAGAAPVQIGCVRKSATYPDVFFEGAVDEFALFRSAFSDTQVTQGLYAAFKPN